MKVKITHFLFQVTLMALFLQCATNLIDIKKQNPELYKALIRDYNVVSEDDLGKVDLLKFLENETQTIEGKIDKFPIESCNWFFDRKEKNKIENTKAFDANKTINLNCGGQYFIIDFDRKNLRPSKLKYKGNYQKIFSQLNLAVIKEASCSIASVNDKEEDTSIECYPYPFDLDRYAKTQRREVIAGYFLYTDSQQTLNELMEASKEEKENDKIIISLKKDFINEEEANNQKTNPSIGKNFTFRNCEFIDFRELPIENIKGKELKDKINKYVESDLTVPTNKEALKDAIEEYRNCGNRCIGKEKEIQLFFEINNLQAKRKIILIKKIIKKEELEKYKRFKFYPLDGKLKSIDFSVKGDIEKIYLDPINMNENINSEINVPDQDESDMNPYSKSNSSEDNNISPNVKNSKTEDIEKIEQPDSEKKSRTKKKEKTQTSDSIEPIPDPEVDTGDLEKTEN